jgi:hypothetical protein
MHKEVIIEQSTWQIIYGLMLHMPMNIALPCKSTNKTLVS